MPELKAENNQFVIRTSHVQNHDEVYSINLTVCLPAVRESRIAARKESVSQRIKERNISLSKLHWGQHCHISYASNPGGKKGDAI